MADVDDGHPDRDGSRPIPADRSGAAAVEPRLLELLVCPVTKCSLDYDPVRQELISRQARLVFPIRDGVPLLTVQAARPLD